MIWGILSEAQKLALKPHIAGKVVHDLGAGTCDLSVELCSLGAKHILAYDTNPSLSVKKPDNLTVRKKSFQDLLGTLQPEIVFVSWPTIAEGDCTALTFLASRAKKVIYLGKCMDGMMCGTNKFFSIIICSELLEHVPDRRNTMLITGNSLPEAREWVPEEVAGIYRDKIYYYDEEYGDDTSSESEPGVWSVFW